MNPSQRTFSVQQEHHSMNFELVLI